MAFIQCEFFSETLGMGTTMNVLLPQSATGQIGVTSSPAEQTLHPVLYLLHGLSDDHGAWMRNTSIERYTAPLGLAVVMPAVQRSYYTDMAHGLNYWQFIRDEVPARAEEFFPVSSDPSERYVAGLSMGGYGAFKLALSDPDRWSAAASLSGALDVANLLELADEERSREYRNVFGDQALRGTPNDLLTLADQAAASPSCPRLYQCCGTEDFLYPMNQTFREHAENLGLPLTYEEEAGDHNWGYWDRKIQRFLQWCTLKE